MSWNGPNLPDLAFAHRTLNADNPDTEIGFPLALMGNLDANPEHLAI